MLIGGRFATKTSDTKSNLNKINHGAIDANNHIALDPDFEKDGDANKTIQARIIAICEDVDEYNKPIGLTFMTTHALNTGNSQQVYHDKDATYEGGGDSPTGTCAFRTKLNDGTLFPQFLKDSVKKEAKGF